MFTALTSKIKLLFQPSRNEFVVTEGRSIEIPFTANVPVGCVGSSEILRKQCFETIYLSMPDFSYDECLSNIKNNRVLFKQSFCGIQISSTNWSSPQYNEVHGFSDGLFNSKDRIFSIKLEKISKHITNAWSRIQIPKIKVLFNTHAMRIKIYFSSVDQIKTPKQTF